MPVTFPERTVSVVPGHTFATDPEERVNPAKLNALVGGAQLNLGNSNAKAYGTTADWAALDLASYPNVSGIDTTVGARVHVEGTGVSARLRYTEPTFATVAALKAFNLSTKLPDGQLAHVNEAGRGGTFVLTAGASSEPAGDYQGVELTYAGDANKHWRRLTDVYRAADFGAKGDDATDDTAAIQAAIDAIENNQSGSASPEDCKVLLFEPGKIYWHSGLTIKERVVLMSTGRENGATLKHTGTGIGIDTPEAGTNTFYCGLSGFRVEGNSNTTNNIRFRQVKRGVCTDLFVETSQEQGILFDSTCGNIKTRDIYVNNACMGQGAVSFDAATAVNTGTDRITITAHGLSAEQPVEYVEEAWHHIVLGTSVNLSTNSISITGHGYTAGDAVRYDGQTADIGGLTTGNTYFVLVTDADTIQLSATSGGAAINLTSVKEDGDFYLSAKRIEGLAFGTTYYVNVVDGNTIQLAATAGGAAIDLTAVGAGTAWLSKAQTKVGAVDLDGTDHQIINVKGNPGSWVGSDVTSPRCYVAGFRLSGGNHYVHSSNGELADVGWHFEEMNYSRLTNIRADLTYGHGFTLDACTSNVFAGWGGNSIGRAENGVFDVIHCSQDSRANGFGLLTYTSISETNKPRNILREVGSAGSQLDRNVFGGFSGRTTAITGSVIAANYFNGPLVSAYSHAFDTLTDGDTTPSVSGRFQLQTANTGATTITDFDGAFPGQQILLYCADGNTSLGNVSSGPGIVTGTGGTLALNNGSLYRLVRNKSGQWLLEGSGNRLTAKIMQFSATSASFNSGVLTVLSSNAAYTPSGATTVTDITLNTTDLNGDLIVIRNGSDTHSITFTHNDAKIRCTGGTDFVLGPYEAAMFMAITSTLYQLVR